MKRAIVPGVISGIVLVVIASYTSLRYQRIHPPSPVAPQIGAAGFLLDDDPDPKFRWVRGINSKWPGGAEFLSPGTAARYLGGAPQSELPWPEILVSLESGPHAGESAVVQASNWHPNPNPPR